MASYGHSCGHSCSQQAPQGHTSMASYGRPRLPFASPKALQTLQTLQTLKTLQTNPSCSHQATSIASAVCQPWNPPNFTLQPTATPRHTSMASYGHSCSQQAPQGHTSMASYGRPRLPFASPKTLQTLETLKTVQTNPSCSHQATSIASAVCQPWNPPNFTLQPTATPRHTNGFLWPLLQPTGTPRPHINGFLWPLLQPTGTPRPHINGFLWAPKSAVCQP